MIATALLLCLLLAAVVTDVTRHKIYNWNTYPGFVAGFVVNTLGWGALGSGWEALQQSLAGFVACGFLMLVCFVLFSVGGGDVKLIAMMGACLGTRQGIEAMLWTFVLGGILGAAILIWQIGLIRIISKSIQHLLIVLRAKSWVPLNTDERVPLKRGLFLAPSGFAAVCIVARDQLLKGL